MKKPISPIDNKPMTELELSDFIVEMDCFDMQETIEEIYAISSKIKLTDEPSKLFELLTKIEQLCEEFIPTLLSEKT